MKAYLGGVMRQREGLHLRYKGIPLLFLGLTQLMTDFIAPIWPSLLRGFYLLPYPLPVSKKDIAVEYSGRSTESEWRPTGVRSFRYRLGLFNFRFPKDYQRDLG